MLNWIWGKSEENVQFPEKGRHHRQDFVKNVSKISLIEEEVVDAKKLWKSCEANKTIQQVENSSCIFV